MLPTSLEIRFLSEIKSRAPVSWSWLGPAQECQRCTFLPYTEVSNFTLLKLVRRGFLYHGHWKMQQIGCHLSAHGSLSKPRMPLGEGLMNELRNGRLQPKLFLPRLVRAGTGADTTNCKSSPQVDYMQYWVVSFFSRRRTYWRAQVMNCALDLFQETSNPKCGQPILMGPCWSYCHRCLLWVFTVTSVRLFFKLESNNMGFYFSHCL